MPADGVGRPAPLDADRDELRSDRGYHAVRVLESGSAVEEVRVVRRETVPHAAQAPDTDGDRPPAVIVDLDGTVASNEWRAHHIRGEERDWEAFFAEMGRDTPVQPLVDLVRWLGRDVDVLLVSGRPAEHEPTVRRWLADHGVVYDELFLRGNDDRRPDTVVKREVYRERIADRWDVAFAIDDREKVIGMWRDEGLYVLEAVDPGHPPLSRR